MIHSSGISARKRLPMSAATSRTRAMTALSSVSGMVKNWGACGSMAPPITVEIMIVLLCRKQYRLGWGTTRRWLRPQDSPLALRVGLPLVPSPRGIVANSAFGRQFNAPLALQGFVLGIDPLTMGAMPASQL